MRIYNLLYFACLPLKDTLTTKSRGFYYHNKNNNNCMNLV